ncbi:hypothetical protein [Prauserella halophila]|uniref:hypothetical protein n=1 Tax=Prauserella halophila TaxID=185641 RepID=UPI0020A24966|nr:hypothetical protein [Prauserella halophila]MCP2236113.1 hypothetical protein [Prauserella halophila]
MTSVHEEGTPSRLVETAQRALLAMRLGDDAGAIEAAALEALAADDTRALMLLLFGTCSEMVTTLGDGGAAPVKVQVFDSEGEEVAIDDAEPPVRTAVRTLLAEVHGNTDDARQQLEIALANASPDEVESLVVQALRWTMRLSTACLERDLPVESWIAEALLD